jgi:magnesium chelatase subunit H
MTPKPTSPASAHPAPLRVVVVTLDTHLAQAARLAERDLRQDMPGLSLTLHAAADWAEDPESLARCRRDIAQADILIVTMLFLEDHIRAVLPDLAARRGACDALLCAMSAAEVVRLTKLGPFEMNGADKGPLALLKKLRGSTRTKSAGEGQMRMLRRLPQILRFLPGKAQDLRAYFLALQYWLSGNRENLANLVRLLVDRYAAGARAAYRGALAVKAPVEHPEVGVYHPALPGGGVSARAEDLPRPRAPAGVVGVLVLRSYVLAGDAGHYDGVIAALEAKGLQVIPVFAAGLDARPAIERFFLAPGGPRLDALVSLTGFSLVGGPAYNDSEAAAAILTRLDAPYLAAHPLEFQSLQRWAASTRGLTPLEATMMVAIPEIDGASGPIVFGGRADPSGEPCRGCPRSCHFPPDDSAPHMRACPERAEALAARVLKLAQLRRTPAHARRLAIVLFNFPPNAGAAGSAAFLGVFESLHATLRALQAAGYAVEPPESVEALRARLLEGGVEAEALGLEAAIGARIPVDDHILRETHLGAIEAQWGAAPGRQLTDGKDLFVLGARFGEVFVGLQPGFGYEGDPMRLLFEQGFAPTHAFAAFYRWLREDFRAHAVVHFGTHGALEFMPGKQTSLSAACWPDRLIADLPNFYLYASNNPSEGAIAKRRSGATLLSYLTPPIAEAGLYCGLHDLKASIERWRAAPPEAASERAGLAALIQEQAAALDLATAAPPWPPAEAEQLVPALQRRLVELEHTLIPAGLHVLGSPPDAAARTGMLLAIAHTRGADWLTAEGLELLRAGASPQSVAARIGAPAGADPAVLADLAALDRLLATDHELPALLHALDGGFTPPAPGGDLLRSPAVLPTGRNLHGFDPFLLPSAFALRDGAAQAQRLLDAHAAAGAPPPETVAMVLWGADSIKSEGGPIAQALALLGAEPKRDSYGRVCGAQLIALEALGRPRIDVLATLSGIFRDLLPLQTQLLAEAAYLAASAPEPLERNFVRKHALAYQAASGCDLETAALRVFSNAEGAYGANVNQLIDAGCWTQEEELADAFEARKSFAYGRNGKPRNAHAVLSATLAHVDLAYQNLESVELGVTTIDHYVDTLGGISRAVSRAKGAAAPVYVGDQTQGAAAVRTLAEQVALETRTRMLNPRWYEGLLQHGFEGVRQIEAHVTNTMGWSATTGVVDSWVYQRISETYVLDPEMRARLAALNPKASARMANRLLEATERNYWRPDAATLAALRAAGDELEDRLEGVIATQAA